MAEPPSYEESTPRSRSSFDQKSDHKSSQRWTIREQVGLSRSQHVTSVVSQLVDHIRERASRGLSKATLALIPSDQDASHGGVVVGFPDGEMPISVQFEGRQNCTQFWLQDEVLFELKDQLRLAVSGGVPAETIRPHGDSVSISRSPRKTSWFGRKSSKTPEPVGIAQPATCPGMVDVRLDEMNFRSETEYGLYQTLRARVVLVIVDVR